MVSTILRRPALLSPVQQCFLAGTPRAEKRLRGGFRTHGRRARPTPIAAPAVPHRVPADYRAAAEFIARNDPHHPALAVKNRNGRDCLLVTRKSDLVHDRSPTHRQPPLSSAYVRPFEAQAALTDCDGRTFPQESASRPLPEAGST